MKSKNELAEELYANLKSDIPTEYFSTTKEEYENAIKFMAKRAFIDGYDSRDAEIAMLLKKNLELESMSVQMKRPLLTEIQELESEKQNLLSAAESDLLRMAELRDENKYLKERLKRYEDKLLGRP